MGMVPEESGNDSALLVARAYGYKLFSVLFARPASAEMMQRLYSEESFEILRALVGVEPLAPLEAERLAWDALDDARRKQWVSEQEGAYNRLFVGPSRLVAPPWESVYRSEDGLLFQQATLEVRGLYRKAGLSVPNRGREADDHISFELDYMAHLCSMQMEGDADARSEQGSFLNEHLLAWLPEFAGRISGSGFYEVVANVLIAFVREDVARLR